MIKITLITVTYNAGSLLQKTLQSVYDQTYSAIEHIIIDGASTDNTVAMAKDYMERSFASDNGHEVRILVEPDNGIYDAMNKGLKLATGDYICFLNAGDALTGTETIKQVVEAAKRCYSGKGKQHDVTTSAEYDRRRCPPWYTARRISWMGTTVSCATAASRRRHISHGARSATECSCATRLSMPVRTLPGRRHTI